MIVFGVVEEVKVGVKSQVVIPLRIREEAEVRPGDILIMTSDRNGRISIMKKPHELGPSRLWLLPGTPGATIPWSMHRKSGKRHGNRQLYTKQPAHSL